MNFKNLTEDQKRQFARNLVSRRTSYTRWLQTKQLDVSKDVLIVGDRPGPKAHQGDDHHHTPFYSKLYSGGWINCELVLAGIAEDRLLWINSATWDGAPSDTAILAKPFKHIFALGNNAAKWLEKNNVVDFIKVLHPQAHKRFHAGERYRLIDHLKDILC